MCASSQQGDGGDGNGNGGGHGGGGAPTAAAVSAAVVAVSRGGELGSGRLQEGGGVEQLLQPAGRPAAGHLGPAPVARQGISR